MANKGLAMATSVLAPATAKAYAAAMLKLQLFALSLQVLNWFPSSVYLLLAFIPHLVEQGLSAATIRSTFSAISFYHTFFLYPDPTRHIWLQKALQADAKARPQADPRSPVTVPMLQSIIFACNSAIPSQYNRALFKAIFPVI